MDQGTPTVRFETVTEIEGTPRTLLDGVPGLGLVAPIVAEQLTEQLGLEHHANLVSDRFPPVATFEDGALREPVRVYAGTDPDLLLLRSDVVLPSRAYAALADAVATHLADGLERAIFLAGATAAGEAEAGTVTGVANTEALRSDLAAAGIDLAPGAGAVGGATGALATACSRAGVPTVVLVVDTAPYRPDPAGARALIEDGLAPLASVDVDTTELVRQEDAIREEMRGMADRMQQMTLRESFESLPPETEPSMFY
jgi:uncharacterized protein